MRSNFEQRPSLGELKCWLNTQRVFLLGSIYVMFVYMLDLIHAWLLVTVALHMHPVPTDASVTFQEGEVTL